MNLKTKIEKTLFEADLLFTVTEGSNNDGDPLYYYTVGEKRGFFAYLNGQFQGCVINNSMVERGRKEGLSDDEIWEDLRIFIQVSSSDKFVSMLISQSKQLI